MTLNTKSALTKSHIIDMATKSIIEGGIENTSIRKIALKSKCATGLINHYFKSKKDLIESVYEGFGDSLYEEMATVANDATMSANDKLKKIVDLNYIGIDKNENLQMWLSFWSLRNEIPKLQLQHERHYKGLVDNLESIFKPTDNKNAKLNAVSLIAIMNGLWFEKALGNKTMSFKDNIKICNIWIDNIVGK